ncbi:MAG TPA: hypothetical protein VLW17_09940 [Thermoanaerobaculaceae bacterium]|nr:hypothetical protein [Thermoanaerobaculaceae bacterium]
MNGIMYTLGLAGANGNPTAEQAVATIKSGGVGALIDQLITRWPSLATKLSNGVRVDYGSGYTTKGGTLVIGSVVATYSGFTQTSSGFSFDLQATNSGLHVNGGTVALQNASGHVACATSGAHPVCDASVSGNGPWQAPSSTDGDAAPAAQSSVTVTGSAHFDLGACPKYPVSGSATINEGGRVKVVGFNGKCDGTYDYSGPAMDRWAVVGPSIGATTPCHVLPNTIMLGYMGYINENGILTIDPALVLLARQLRPTGVYTGSGVLTANQVTGRYSYTYTEDDGTPTKVWCSYTLPRINAGQDPAQYQGPATINLAMPISDNCTASATSTAVFQRCTDNSALCGLGGFGGASAAAFPLKR